MVNRPPFAIPATSDNRYHSNLVREYPDQPCLFFADMARLTDRVFRPSAFDFRLWLPPDRSLALALSE